MAIMRLPLLYLTGLLLSALPVGCSPASKPQGSDALRELQRIGMGYHRYYEAENRGPAKAEDLESHLKEYPAAYEGLKSGRYVFFWNVRLLDMKDGTATTVLAYERDVPTKGGYVLMGDGGVLQMTAQEFQAAPKAK